MVETPDKTEPTSAAPAAPRCKLLKKVVHSPEKLTLMIGGMDEEHFARLPVPTQRIIDAIEVEREIVFLVTQDIVRDDPVLDFVYGEMQRYAKSLESVNDEDSYDRNAYVDLILDHRAQISSLINGHDRRLTVGNNPGKLDRDWPFPCIKAARQVKDLLCNMYSDDPSKTFKLGVAFEEALLNHARHGNGCDPRKMCRVNAQIEGSTMVVDLQDEGWGFSPAAVGNPTDRDRLETANGRGLLIMRSFLDTVDFGDGGRACTLTKKLP